LSQALFDAEAEVAKLPSQHRLIDVPRADRDHANSLSRVIDRHRAHHLEHGALARAVGDQMLAARERGIGMSRGTISASDRRLARAT
jgi:hypothetical protein